MQKKFQKTLFIFRRDLRLNDNSGLNHALQQSDVIIPCFIFDPRQVSTKNSYKSNNALQFMLESLHDLALQIAKQDGILYFFYGSPEKIVKTLIKKEKLDAIFCNRDYTPFSKERDTKIAALCEKEGVKFYDYADALLHEPEDIQTTSKKPYSLFTPFFNKARKFSVRTPSKKSFNNFYKKDINLVIPLAEITKKILPAFNTSIHQHGGTINGLLLLSAINNLKNYKKTHNIPSIDTSYLSAHLKFGTLSIRQIYHTIQKKLGINHTLIRQLYWRDFFTHTAYHFPHVFGNACKTMYNHLSWKNNKKDFAAWCNGTTGFPIIDAGMRQLVTTGFMHNRVRMIVASFLVKDLHIDWRWGENFFAQHLIDYDPMVNNGNWQWCASTGCDAQPYFRIFNPWLQQKKYDPECIYIKKWVPELQNTDPAIIHSWFLKKYHNKVNYNHPIIEHKKEALISIKNFKTCKLHSST